MARKIFPKEEVRLLNCDEYLQHKEIIPELNDTWWLMDKGAGNCFGFVVGKNKLYKGDYINNAHAVRPVIVTTLSSKHIGEQATMYSIDWIKYAEKVIDKYTTIHYFLSIYPISTSIFDEKTNIYNDSTIKQLIEKHIPANTELDETDKEKAKRLKREEKEARKKKKFE